VGDDGDDGFEAIHEWANMAAKSTRTTITPAMEQIKTSTPGPTIESVLGSSSA
jgi:hypothetical protein